MNNIWRSLFLEFLGLENTSRAKHSKVSDRALCSELLSCHRSVGIIFAKRFFYKIFFSKNILSCKKFASGLGAWLKWESTSARP
jgi:hypothetical protein